MKYKPGDIVARPDCPKDYLMVTQLQDGTKAMPRSYYVLYRLCVKHNDSRFLIRTVRMESVDDNYLFITSILRREGY